MARWRSSSVQNGMLTKVKAGKVKRRIILDLTHSPVASRPLKKQHVNSATIRKERVVLPRATDVTEDVLDALGEVEQSSSNMSDVDGDVELLVLDFADAFYIVPLRHSQRRYYCTAFRGKIIVFLTTAQGSVNAPLTWGRLAALIGRITQSVFPKLDAAIRIYVDDPAIVLRGKLAERNRFVAMIILLWSSLGLPLSVHKATRGKNVDWIGANFQISCGQVCVSAKKEAFSDFAELIALFLRSNVISLRQLETYAGKASHIASLLWLSLSNNFKT